MALELFTENVSVHQGLGDNPNTDNNLSADELKALFDRPAELIKDFINNKMIPAINKGGGSGGSGASGTTFTPHVDADGNLSWTNDGGLANPATVNIKGPRGDTGPAGASGANGADGADGKTPVKGVDYFTEEEQATMIAEVKEAVEATNVTAIDFSDFENGSFKETVNGEVVTHSVTFDTEGRPITIDSVAITWGAV